MSSEGSERNRDLIERSAALLAADHPFEILIERLCNLLSVAFEATVDVALPNDDGTVRLYYVAQRGLPQETHDQLMPEGSRVAQVFHSGRPLIVSDGASEALICVPVAYGDAVLGVLSITHPRAATFDRDDLAVAEAIARHLAIGIRGQRTLGGSAVPARYPWLTLIALLLVVAVATVVTVFTANNRVHDVQSNAASRDRDVATNAARIVQETLDRDAQLATLGASVVGPVRDDRQLATALLQRLLDGESGGPVDRIGAFSAPARLGVFVTRIAGANAIREVRGYARSPWYRAALARPHDVVYLSPETPGNDSFVRAARAFSEGAHGEGVVTAGVRLNTFERALGRTLPSGATATIKDAAGHAVLRVGEPRVDQPVSIDVPLSNVAWTVHVSVSSAALSAQVRRLVAIAAIAVLSIWCLGIALFVSLHLMYRTRRDAARLKAQRAELQSEIASRIDSEEQLRAAAYHDTLTGLPNRAFFLNQLGDVIEQRRLKSGSEYAVLFIDLDRFYVVNDSLGHNVGDQLLAAIAYRLEETVPPHALIARLGGDEFVLLLPAAGTAIQEAIAIAEDVLDALRISFALGEREVYSGASIGIVKIDDTYNDSESILRDADIAMYHAKRSGRARYAVFDHAMRQRVTQQLELEGSLRGAVDRGEIVAFYQPIVSVKDERIVGFEALARWYRDGKDTTVSASDFVPVAELTGMMRAIDAELFAQVCRDVAGFTAIDRDIHVSVNVSAGDLTRASLLADIDSTLERFSVPSSAFQIEITETAVMEDAERALAMLNELRARGLDIVVDDFGAGYSSLSYLQRLPLAGVKIDRSFIVPLPGNGQALEIVRAIIALAKTLGLHVTAEGVEREEQFSLLRALGVDYAQGYWFSPPVDVEAAKTLFAVRS